MLVKDHSDIPGDYPFFANNNIIIRKDEVIGIVILILCLQTLTLILSKRMVYMCSYDILNHGFLFEGKWCVI